MNQNAIIAAKTSFPHTTHRFCYKYPYVLFIEPDIVVYIFPYILRCCKIPCMVTYMVGSVPNTASNYFVGFNYR